MYLSPATQLVPTHLALSYSVLIPQAQLATAHPYSGPWRFWFPLLSPSRCSQLLELRPQLESSPLCWQRAPPLQTQSALALSL